MEPKTYILDRWEENWAVLEQADGSLLNIPRQELPPGSREGDILQNRRGLAAFAGGQTGKGRGAAPQIKQALEGELKC